MPAALVKEFLDSQQVKYVTLTHSPAYTAQEVAESAHVSGLELVKSVILMADDRPVMAVLPAAGRVHLGRLRQVIGANELCLADESQFQELFPGCEVGAIPPFGNLYYMNVYVSDKLPDHEDVVFSAGSHTELIRLSYEDYSRLVEPVVVET